MTHIGRCASVTSYGGSKREWLSLTCDGVPYMLMRKVMQEATFAAMKEKLGTLGWIDTSKMLVKDLKAVLKLKKLPVSGLKADLIARIDSDINRPLLDSPLVKSILGEVAGEFDWVVPCIGGLHQEFKICRAFVDVNWDVCYHAFALSQGYHGDRQLAYVKSGKDHHKTFDDISRYIDGITDELLYQYCVATGPTWASPSVAGFLEWVKSVKKNATIQFLFQQCCQFGIGIMIYRHGIRHNDANLSILGWRMCSPLTHCRNHPR